MWPHELQHARVLCHRLSLTLLKCMSMESVMQSNHLILWHPFLLLPSTFPSSRVFSNDHSSHQVVKVLELQLQDQSFQWVFRVDFLRIDWIDLLAVQGTLKSLLQHRSTTIQKHHFFGAHYSLWSNSHICRVKTMVFLVVLYGYGREALENLNFSWLKPTKKW